MDISMLLPPELNAMIASYLEEIDIVVGRFVCAAWYEWLPCRKIKGYIAAVAAQKGYLEILKWARGNGCNWDKWVCIFAAQGGYLEVLKWARDNSCPGI